MNKDIEEKLKARKQKNSRIAREAPIREDQRERTESLIAAWLGSFPEGEPVSAAVLAANVLAGRYPGRDS
jgi:hypothetical protein